MLRRFVIAGMFLLVTVAAVVAWVWFPWVFSPSYTILIATGPPASDGQKFIAAFRRELAEEHPRVRLALEEKADLKESAEALQGGKFDLAVARSDHPAAARGGTLVILRRLALVIMVPAKSPINSMKGLVGKRIGVLEGTAVDDPLLKTVMEFYGLDPGNIVKSTAAEIGTLLSEKRISAVVSIGPVGPGAVADAAKAITKATKKPPKFIDLESEAISERSPVYDEMEIPLGAFVAAPAVPDEKVKTVAATVRLVAKKSMLKDVASEITRLLLVTRAKLASTMPQAGQIEAPETDKKSFLPVHPGAAGYLDGSQESLFDEAMNLLFNISIIGGVSGSVVLWVRGYWRRHLPNGTQKNLARMPALLREAKSVPPDQLDAIEEELDNLSGWLLDRLVREEISPDRISGIAVAISHIREIVGRRRKS